MDEPRIKSFHCISCEKSFFEDANLRITDIKCPNCGSGDVGSKINRRRSFSGKDDDAVLVEDLLQAPRRMIIKVYSIIKNFHPLYFVSPADIDTPPLGTITRKGLAVMDKTGILTEIPGQEILEKYGRNKWLTADADTSKYYELKTLPA